MPQKTQNLSGFWLLAALAFTIIALVWTRPLYNYLFSGIPYEVGPQPDVQITHLTSHDCLQLYYKYWLFKESMLGNIPLFSDPYEFAIPDARGFTGQQFPISLLYAVFSAISPLFGYNAIILLSFLACGLFMMKLAHLFTRDLSASFIAGVIFTIMPFRLPQLMAGHPNGTGVAFLPLILLFSELSMRRGKFLPSLMAGLSFSSMAMVDMQLAFFSSLLLAVYIPCRLIMLWFVEAQKNRYLFNRQAARWLTGLAIGASIGIVFLVGVKLFLLSKSALHSTGGPVSKIAPAFSDFWDISVAGERRIYMGPWVIALSILGLLLPCVTNTFPPYKRKHALTALFCFLTMTMGLVLSLGHSQPFASFIQKIPLIGLSRTPARATIITFTAASILAAYALTSIRRLLILSRKNFIYYPIWILCLALILHNYWLPGPRGINMLPSESPVFQTAVKEKPSARVLAVPVWPGESAWSANLLYHITLSRVHFINGYSPLASLDYQEKVFQPLQMVNVGQFNKEEMEKARNLKVSHVSFHPESFPAPQWISVFPGDLTLKLLKQSRYLEYVMYDDPIHLFRVLDAPKKTYSQPVTSPIGISVPASTGAQTNGIVIEDTNSIMGNVLSIMGTPHQLSCLFTNRGRIYPAGKYTLSLRFKSDPIPGTSAAGILILKAVETESGRTLAELNMPRQNFPPPGKYTWAKFPLLIQSAARVRFEAWSNTNIPLTFDLWHMVFAQEENNTVFEAEDMFHVGRVKENPDMSGGAFVHTSSSDPATFIVRGPYRFLPPGNHIMRVNLMTENTEQNTQPVRFEIASQLQPDSRKRVVLATSEWTPPQEKTGLIKAIDIPFTVPQNGAIIECTLHRPRDITLYIDSFEINPGTPAP